MNKIVCFVLSLITLVLIFFGIFAIFSHFLELFMPNWSLFFASILISLLVLLIFRKNIETTSNYLLKIYLSIFSGFFLTMFIILLTGGISVSSIILIFTIYFLIGFIFVFILSIKKTIRAFYAFLFLFLIFIFLGFIISEMQKSTLKKYEKKLVKIGFSFDLKELFPNEYSKPICDEWLEKLKIFTEKNGKWGNFYNDFVLPYHEEKFFDFLKNGKNPKNEILSDPKNKEKIWEEFINYNISIKESMEKCLHIIWFEPEEYKDKLVEVPAPNLLSIIKFSRTLFVSSIILRAQGDIKRADEMLDELYEAKLKMKIKGQPLINIFIANAMERIYLLGEASSISLGNKLSKEGIEKIEEISKDDLSAFISSLNVEYFTIFSILRNPKSKHLTELSDLPYNEKVLKYIPKFLLRAFIKTETENYLFNAYEHFKFIKKVKPDENKYFWKDLKGIISKPSFIYLDIFIRSTYGKALSLITKSRVLLLANEIFKYLDQNKKLPENIDFLENNLFIDPFSENM